MSTYMAKPGSVERKWYIIDAAGKPMGRVAAQAASIIRGKHRPEYTPNVDCGENVIVINCSQMLLTGKKLTEKFYRTHSGYVGHLKEVPYRDLMEKRPEMAMELAVRGMLPKSALGKKMLGHLYAFAGEHNMQAQKPVVLE